MCSLQPPPAEQKRCASPRKLFLKEFRVKILSLEDEAARLNGLLGEGWSLGTEGSRRLAEDAAHAAAHPGDFEDDDDVWEDAQRPRHFEDDDVWEDDDDVEDDDDDDDDWEHTDEEQEGEGGFGRRALTFEEASQETRC